MAALRLNTNCVNSMEPAASNSNQRKQVEVTAADMPLHCPLPSQKLWNAHPRVFLPISKTGEALCPYCGTRYILHGDFKPAH